MIVEFQFFEGCPNSDATLKNLLELVSENIIEENEVKITEIKNPEDAEKLSFQGSPTILMNSIDIYNGKQPSGSSYSCRSYIFEGKRTGVLSKEYIQKKYIELRKYT